MAVTALGILALMGICWLQFRAARGVPRLIDPLSRMLRIPSRWEAMPTPQGLAAAFHDSGLPPMRSFLLAKVEPRPEGGARQALADALQKAQETLPAFEARAPSKASTEMRPPHAVVVNFYFENQLPNGTGFPVAGTTVARDIGEQTLSLTWFGPPGELDRQRWDLARILQESELE